VLLIPNTFASRAITHTYTSKEKKFKNVKIKIKSKKDLGLLEKVRKQVKPK